MRRKIAALSTLVVLGLALPAQTHATELWDVHSHWARTAIAAGVADGYIKGFPDGSFRPDAPITRAEFFTMLAGALHLGARPADPAAYAPWHWAVQQGQLQAAVAGGLLNPPDYANWIAPDEPIRRREIVLAVVRAVGREGLVGQHALAARDSADYPQWLRDWAAEAVAAGVLQGYEDGALGLERTATRAEALVMVQRIREQVTMQLAPGDVAASPDTLRAPAADEPTWTLDRADPVRPVFSDGAHSYALDVALQAYELHPAPGGAAWLTAVTEQGEHRLYRLQGGEVDQVGTYAEPIVALALGDDGRLWFSRGGDLLAADRNGKVEALNVGEQLTYGALDARGTLWAVGAEKLYRILDGRVASFAVDADELERVRGLVLAPDSAVWLLLKGEAEGPRVEAVRLQNGRIAERTPVVPRPFGGAQSDVQAALLDSQGSSLLILAVADEPSLFRFDLATGASARLIAPDEVGSGARVLPAPDGGAVLADAEGRFWRVLN